LEFLLPFSAYERKYPTKYLALYHTLRDEILHGRLQAGLKLPSSRVLAQLYQLSRGTVSQVYEMLHAEGYLSSQPGRGTFVAYDGGLQREKPLISGEAKLSTWGLRVKSFSTGKEKAAGSNRGQGHSRIRFHTGMSDGLLFPREEWNRHMYEQVRRMTESSQSDILPAEGLLELREAIAQQLRRERGIDTSAERIVIVNGSMQAIALLTQILVDPGDPVIVESPGYSGVSRAVLAAGGKPVYATVDEQGLIPQAWESRLLFVTPSRQFPTGAVLSMERRQQLLRWAAERDAVVVEDDYDSEFRHRGRPLEPLKGLDQEGRVVYIGTFSKTMLRNLRIGYVVLPASLHASFAAAKRLFEPQPAGLLEQSTLAAFMQSGGYARHLRRMRRVYAGKFLQLQSLLQENLSTHFDWVEGDAGLHLFGWWRGEPAAYAAYAAACEKAGVSWIDAGPYHMPRGRAGACFGFAHLTESEMRESVRILREITKNVVLEPPS
jgi:GntR family transcriptional regulator/MocR family aminotransferase